MRNIKGFIERFIEKWELHNCPICGHYYKEEQHSEYFLTLCSECGGYLGLDDTILGKLKTIIKIEVRRNIRAIVLQNINFFVIICACNIANIFFGVGFVEALLGSILLEVLLLKYRRKKK